MVDDSGFAGVHDRLRAIMLDAAVGQSVAVDEPGNLVVHTSRIDPKTGQAGWFGTVTTKKSYVAYHLMSLSDDPTLGEGLSERLSKRRQGKTCFNFRTIDEPLFGERAALTRRATGAERKC